MGSVREIRRLRRRVRIGAPDRSVTRFSGDGGGDRVGGPFGHDQVARCSNRADQDQRSRV